MAQKRTAAKLHLLTVKEVRAAKDGDRSDGGGLMLRERGESAFWVFRFTSPSGRRREMGLGVALRGSAKQAEDALTGARDDAHKAREVLRRGTDPIEARDQQREAAKRAEEARKATKTREAGTLARCARDYHQQVIERNRTVKHAAQWIKSLEKHIPASLWHAPIDSIQALALLAALNEIKPHEGARSIGDVGPTPFGESGSGWNQCVRPSGRVFALSFSPSSSMLLTCCFAKLPRDA
jgi:Arm DNA-binding domain